MVFIFIIEGTFFSQRSYLHIANSLNSNRSLIYHFLFVFTCILRRGRSFECLSVWGTFRPDLRKPEKVMTEKTIANTNKIQDK